MHRVEKQYTEITVRGSGCLPESYVMLALEFWGKWSQALKVVTAIQSVEPQFASPSILYIIY